MPVELNVRSELSKIITELVQLHDKAEQVGNALGDAGKKIGDGVDDQAKKTETLLERLRGYSGRVADQMKRDFKALASINAVAGSLKFSEMFRGSIRETVTLSDTVRKLGTTLQIARSDMSRFQEQATKTMAKVGLSSEAAANSLSGLAETPVRGTKNLLQYATTAGQLASISREQGKEAEISKGLSGVITARGGNPNDLAQLKAVSDDVLRIRAATGKSATEILSAMNSLFSGANQAFQKRLQGGGAVSLATAALVGGKDATGFLERFLHTNLFERFGAQAQGLGNIVGGSGALNLSAMEAVLGTAKGRGMGDAQAGLTTMGLSDEEAQGFIRLTEALRQNQVMVDGARTKQVDLNATYRESLGLSESFNRVLNKTKGAFSGVLSPLTQGLTNGLSSAGDTTAGALATTAGAGVLAAMLAGGGLRGLGKAVGVEAATGREVQPVFVTNFPLGFGAGDALGGIGKGAGIAGALSTAGLVGAGVAVGGAVVAAGMSNDARLTEEALAPLKRQESRDADQKKILQDINSSLQQMKVTDRNGRVEVDIRMQSPDLKATRPPSRGRSFGP